MSTIDDTSDKPHVEPVRKLRVFTYQSDTDIADDDIPDSILTVFGGTASYEGKSHIDVERMVERTYVISPVDDDVFENSRLFDGMKQLFHDKASLLPHIEIL
jgi:hypothetical protein